MQSLARVSFRFNGETVEFYRNNTLAFVLTLEAAVKMSTDIIKHFLLINDRKVSD